MAEIRVAVATDDGLTSDVRFGDLSTLRIYEYDPVSEGFVYKETREVSGGMNRVCNEKKTSGLSCKGGNGTRCSDDTFLNELIAKISDCDYLLLGKIGPRPVRTLLREGISALEKGGEINESLLLLSSYIGRRKRAMTRINKDLH